MQFKPFFWHMLMWGEINSFKFRVETNCNNKHMEREGKHSLFSLDTIAFWVLPFCCVVLFTVISLLFFEWIIKFWEKLNYKVLQNLKGEVSSLNDQLVWGAPWLSIRLQFLVLLFILAAPSPCSFRVLVGGPLLGGMKYILFYKLKFIFMLFKLGITIFQSIK